MIAWHIQRPVVTGGARTPDDNALCSQLCKASRQTVCGRTRSTRTRNPWRSSTRFSSFVDRPLCKYADDLSQMHANFRERSRDTHQQQGHSRQPLGTSRVQTQFRRTVTGIRPKKPKHTKNCTTFSHQEAPSHVASSKRVPHVWRNLHRSLETALLQPSLPTCAFRAMCTMLRWSRLSKSPAIVKMPPMTAQSCTKKCDIPSRVSV